jgi:hypothetical protein
MSGSPNFPPGDWRRSNPDFQEPKLSQNLALVDRLRAIGVRHGKSPGEVAIAWTLRNPAVTGAIVGAPQCEAGRWHHRRRGSFSLRGKKLASSKPASKTSMLGPRRP